MNDLQMFQYLDKYSRYNYDLLRYENWNETVDRTVNHLKYLVKRYAKNDLDSSTWQRIYNGILKMKVAPAMRMFSIAGEAGIRSGIGGYNCAYMPIVNFKCFEEAVLILMSGTGLGYSVEGKYISQFPPVEKRHYFLKRFKFEDTTESWAEGILFGIQNWWKGFEVLFDYSAIRPAGTPLKTKGGRASGSDSLKKSLDKIKTVIQNREEQRIRSIDIHDIMCLIAECIVAGGVRRSALISLFDKDDQLMLTCKDNGNIKGNEHRYCSNNSAVWLDRLSKSEIDSFIESMIDGNNGEPGIFSRYAVKNTLPKRRKYNDDMGTNPCGEVILGSDQSQIEGGQFCNLTSVIARENDNKQTLLDKIELATIIGTIQSLETNFPGLRDGWKQNCIEERLLGVDIQGVCDCHLLFDPRLLEKLRNHAIKVNKQLAKHFNIAQSTATTVNKPSGNSSILYSTSPGIHTRWSEYYIRRAQIQKQSPITKLFLEQASDFIEPLIYAPDTTFVISFPIKSPENSLVRNDLSCIQQCENWKLFKNHYVEHNPSVTITYKEYEIDDLKQWIFDNQEIVGGMAFLPYDDSIYKQAPYEKITQEQYKDLNSKFAKIDWSQLEQIDYSTKVLACDSNKCELVYI